LVQAVAQSRKQSRVRGIAKRVARRVRPYGQIEAQHLADRSEIAEREVHKTTLEAPQARMVDISRGTDIAQAEATPDAGEVDVGGDSVQLFS
jgi:hypothetical protein